MGDHRSDVRVIVTGGRAYTDQQHVRDTLDQLLAEIDARVAPVEWLAATAKSQLLQLILIQGGAPGADAAARNWAALHRDRVISITEPANWQRDGKAAGPRRNQRMLDLHHPDLVVAFPGRRGTADMVEKARGALVPVIEARPRHKPTHSVL